MGKVVGLLFDSFGDFDGFQLDGPDGFHEFFSRERDVKILAERAWRERLRITVRPEPHQPHRIESIVVHQPPEALDA